jgi:hypothetical protein
MRVNYLILTMRYQLLGVVRENKNGERRKIVPVFFERKLKNLPQSLSAQRNNPMPGPGTTKGENAG